MNTTTSTITEGDIIELTIRGERRTADVMLVTDDGVVLLDLLDGERPAWAWVSHLQDAVVFRPDAEEHLAAA